MGKHKSFKTKYLLRRSKHFKNDDNQMHFFLFLLEFVSTPVDQSNFDERQEVNGTSRIFHFQTAGVHAYIQVSLA